MLIRLEGRHPRPDGIWLDFVLEEDGKHLGPIEAQVPGPASDLRSVLRADLEFGSAIATADHPCSFIQADRYTLRVDGSFEHVHERGRPENPDRAVRRGRWTFEDDFTVRVTIDRTDLSPAARIAPEGGRRWTWAPEGAEATFDNRGSEATAVGLEPFEDAPWPTPRALSIRATIVPASGPGSDLRREIVSRSLERGERQFPFGLRLAADHTLEGWVNTSGTSLVVCRSQRTIPREAPSVVGLTYDGEAIALTVEGDEVAREPAPGSIQNTSGRTVIGGQRHGATRGNGFLGRIERVELQAGEDGAGGGHASTQGT